MGILLFFIILGILVVSHEFGHFITAKFFGIRVDEFGFGFPPRLFGFKYGETTYTINLIPFGGFVKIWGEDAPENAAALPDYERSFVGKSKSIQAAVIVAGVVFNLLLAWLLLSVGLMIGTPVSSADTSLGTIVNQRVVVTEILKDSPAARAGLLPGDTILGVTDSTGTTIQPRSAADVQDFIRAQSNGSFALEYERGGEEATTIQVTPVSGLTEGHPAIGVAMDTLGTVRLGPLSAIAHGAQLTYELTKSTAFGLYAFANDLIFGKAALDSVTGPVGLIGVVGTSIAFGFSYLLSLTAIISINLAIMNLLPIPALDGGRLLFILIEKIKGSPVKPDLANKIHAGGFIALILLMVFITWHDVAKLITG